MMQPERRRICSNCKTANSADAQICVNCKNELTPPPNDIPPNQTNPHGIPPSRPTPSHSADAPRSHDSFAYRAIHYRPIGGLQAGDRLRSYRIVRRVGRGGFGAVYEAWHVHLHRRHVAVKEMSYAGPDEASRQQAIEIFESEANILENLSHANLPKVHDFFFIDESEDSGKAYLVMDYIDGVTLQKVLDEVNGPLNEQRVLHWALQLCHVLSYLHAQNPPVIFRDLKPSNIMMIVGAEGQEIIKLIDFGIARIFKGNAEGDTRVILTPNFAPPEQHDTSVGAQKRETDARSDIYALGATLYYLLTNTLPIDARMRRTLMHNVNTLTLISPNQLTGVHISSNMEEVILKALAMDPDARFQSADEMKRELLTNMSAPLPVSIAPTIPTFVSEEFAPTDKPGKRGTRKSMIRRDFLWYLLGGVGAVAVAGTGIGLYEMTHPSGPTVIVPANALSFDFAYSTEKESWLAQAIDDFNKQAIKIGDKPIVVNIIDENGSVDVQSNILNGVYKNLVAWSPASGLEINQVNAQKQIVITTGNLQPVSLVSSPLVFGVWQQRANQLLLHYKQQTIDWPLILDALPKEWSALGGSPNWGAVKFAQTRPTESNSGLLTITLLAYYAASKDRGLTQGDAQSAAFTNALTILKNSIILGYGHSSGTYLNGDVLGSGPPQTDIVATYENLLLATDFQQKAQQKYGQSMQMFYPHNTILSDHPFALLQGTKPEQQTAAIKFRNFLLSRAQQQRAVELGFRPGSDSVKITDPLPNNPFSQLPKLAPGHTITQILTLAQVPDGNVINTLVNSWQTINPSPQMANG